MLFVKRLNYEKENFVGVSRNKEISSNEDSEPSRRDIK